MARRQNGMDLKRARCHLHFFTTCFPIKFKCMRFNCSGSSMYSQYKMIENRDIRHEHVRKVEKSKSTGIRGRHSARRPSPFCYYWRGFPSFCHSAACTLGVRHSGGQEGGEATWSPNLELITLRGVLPLVTPDFLPTATKTFPRSQSRQGAKFLIQFSGT